MLVMLNIRISIATSGTVRYAYHRLVETVREAPSNPVRSFKQNLFNHHRRDLIPGHLSRVFWASRDLRISSAL